MFQGLTAGIHLARGLAVPSLDHEAPLAVLRREPGIVAVLREALGVELPRFDGVEIGDPDFNQPLPTEFRADLVVLLRGEGPAHEPVMGIVVEVQRARDDHKRRSGLAVLSALAHDNGPCGLEVVIAAFAAISELPRDQGIEYYVLICASLNEVMRRAVEKPIMRSIEPYLVLDWQKQHYYAGKADGKLDAARSFVIELAERRFGDIGDELRLRVGACTDTARLRELVLQVATAADRASVERLLASL